MTAGVEVWVADPARLVQPGSLDAVSDLLTTDELGRYRRLRSASHRREGILARGLLRCTLARSTGLAPRALAFELTAEGQPKLRRHQQPASEPPVSFSVTHTAGLVAVAISGRGAIGIDAERSDRLGTDAKRFAATHFHPKEAASVDRLATDDARAMAIRLWCLKEAYAKATGRGLRVGTASVRFELDCGEVRGPVSDGGEDLSHWRACILPGDRSHVLAIAAPYALEGTSVRDGHALLPC
ncbi:MAG: 4'-phosphopantetheinyl transferase superfamily protein [Pseudomonadota bacterium]